MSPRLSSVARGLIEDPANSIFFSTINIWEIAIKYGLRQKGFLYEPRGIRDGLLRSGFPELTITSAHALAVGSMPALHRDPFDRLLIAQAVVEDMTLLTSDSVVAQYPGPIQQL